MEAVLSDLDGIFTSKDGQKNVAEGFSEWKRDFCLWLWLEFSKTLRSTAASAAPRISRKP